MFDAASKSKSGSLSKSKGHRKALRHEKLDVYRLAINYVVGVYESEEAHGAETGRIDPDPDSDSDLDKTKPRQGGGGVAEDGACSARALPRGLAKQPGRAGPPDPPHVLNQIRDA